MPLVTVFGGTGFLGRRVVGRLMQEGATVRVAVRHPEWVDGGAIPKRSGRIISVSADVRDEASVASAITGAEAVVNAVSAYVEKAGVTYTAVHAQGAGNVAKECERQGVAGLCTFPASAPMPDRTPRTSGLVAKESRLCGKHSPARQSFVRV